MQLILLDFNLSGVCCCGLIDLTEYLKQAGSPEENLPARSVIVYSWLMYANDFQKQLQEDESY